MLEPRFKLDEGEGREMKNKERRLAKQADISLELGRDTTLSTELEAVGWYCDGGSNITNQTD